MSDPRITSGDPLSGYTSAPPPGAGGIAVAPSDAPIAGRWELSGWWRRVWAQVIDGIVIGLIALVFFLIIGAIVGGGFLVGDTTGYIAAVLGFLAWGICILVAALLYAPLMMAKTNGKTLGRMALGIRVVRANGQAITFGYANSPTPAVVDVNLVAPRGKSLATSWSSAQLHTTKIQPRRRISLWRRRLSSLPAPASRP